MVFIAAAFSLVALLRTLTAIAHDTCGMPAGTPGSALVQRGAAKVKKLADTSDKVESEEEDHTENVGATTMDPRMPPELARQAGFSAPTTSVPAGVAGNSEEDIEDMRHHGNAVNHDLEAAERLSKLKAAGWSASHAGCNPGDSWHNFLNACRSCEACGSARNEPCAYYDVDASVSANTDYYNVGVGHCRDGSAHDPWETIESCGTLETCEGKCSSMEDCVGVAWAANPDDDPSVQTSCRDLHLGECWTYRAHSSSHVPETTTSNASAFTCYRRVQADVRRYKFCQVAEHDGKEHSAMNCDQGEHAKHQEAIRLCPTGNDQSPGEKASAQTHHFAGLVVLEACLALVLLLHL